jgi:hypothetical protein
MDPRNDIEGLKMTNAEDHELEGHDGEKAGFQEEDKEFEEAPPKGRRETERELDHGLKETFPASDPVSINPGAD